MKEKEKILKLYKELISFAPEACQDCNNKTIYLFPYFFRYNRDADKLKPEEDFVMAEGGEVSFICSECIECD